MDRTERHRTRELPATSLVVAIVSRIMGSAVLRTKSDQLGNTWKFLRINNLLWRQEVAVVGEIYPCSMVSIGYVPKKMLL